MRVSRLRANFFGFSAHRRRIHRGSRARGHTATTARFVEIAHQHWPNRGSPCPSTAEPRRPHYCFSSGAGAHGSTLRRSHPLQATVGRIQPAAGRREPVPLTRTTRSARSAPGCSSPGAGKRAQLRRVAQPHSCASCRISLVGCLRDPTARRAATRDLRTNRGTYSRRTRLRDRRSSSPRFDGVVPVWVEGMAVDLDGGCLLYTSDAADE